MSFNIIKDIAEPTLKNLHAPTRIAGKDEKEELIPTKEQHIKEEIEDMR